MARLSRVRRLCLLLLAGLIPTAVNAQPAQNWSFEDGTLQGWTATGYAFSGQPTFGNNLTPRRPGESPGQEGNYWIGTFENRNSPRAPLGLVQGDEPQGTLTSPPFTIEGQSISFMIGGGRDMERQYAALLLRWEPGMPPPIATTPLVRLPDGDYITVRKATGRDIEEMMLHLWEVTPYRGKTARIQIVDQSSGPWGHINVDRVSMSWVQPLGRAVLVDPPRAGSPPQQGSGTATAYPVGGGSGPIVVGTPYTPSPPGSDPLARRYRLVASSFTVEHQTVDDMLERDGRGDEIFVRGDIYEFQDAGHFARHRTVKSAVFGARTEIRAGSGAPGFGAADDQHGGLLSNDRYPPTGDNFESRPASRRGDLPMVLWEGELKRGDEVLIVPSIWEWDSMDASQAERAWATQIDGQAPALRLGQPRILPLGQSGPTFSNGGVISNDLIRPIMVYDDGNRPIGAMPGGAFRTSDGMPVNAMVLTWETAERLANQVMMFTARSYDSDGTVVGNVEYPGPAGGLEIRMADPQQLEGRYLLYLRLERVN
jgi:hypothetical protein